MPGPNTESRRCAGINGTGRARTLTDTDHLTRLSNLDTTRNLISGLTELLHEVNLETLINYFRPGEAVIGLKCKEWLVLHPIADLGCCHGKSYYMYEIIVESALGIIELPAKSILVVVPNSE